MRKPPRKAGVRFCQVLNQDDMTVSGGLGAIEKALHLLDFFGQGQSTQSLTELSKASGVSKATCHRTLRVLQQYGLVDREGDGYRLGYRILELAAHVKSSIEPWNVGMDLMDRLRDEVDQSVQLVIRDGCHGIYVEVLPASSPARLYVRPGRRAPLYAGASTRLLLAALDDDEVLAILGELKLHPLTDRTPRSETEVLAKLRTVRETWCALSLGEMEPYSAELALPIIGARGRVVGALSVAGAERHYLARESLQSLLVALDAAALGISRRLGFDVAWPTRPEVFLSLCDEGSPLPADSSLTKTAPRA